MLRLLLLAAVLSSLAVASSPPSAAHAVPVPLDMCAPGIVSPGAPCLPEGEGHESPLASAARSGAEVIQKVLSTASFGLF